jgi:hypothetical protein
MGDERNGTSPSTRVSLVLSIAADVDNMYLKMTGSEDVAQGRGQCGAHVKAIMDLRLLTG